LRFIILGFEDGLLRLHLWLEPLERNGLLFIALVVGVGGIVALLSGRPSILTHWLKTLERVKYASYIVIAAGSFTVGSSIAVGDYQPDIRLRLVAEETREMHAAVGLLLAEHIRDQLRTGNNAALMAYAKLATAAAAERDELAHLTDKVNKLRAERAGIRTEAEYDLAEPLGSMTLPVHQADAEPGDLLGAYTALRKEADQATEREEAAKKALKAAIVQAADLGAFGAAPFVGLLHEYVSESIDDAAEVIVQRMLDRARFTDLVPQGQDVVHALAERLHPLLPAVVARLIATRPSPDGPRLPPEFRDGVVEDVHAQPVKAEQREIEERRPRMAE
jgi:hypothetical protein